MGNLLSSLMTAIIGGLIAVAVQYLIVYDKIEKPKLEIEAKKVELEIRKTAIEAQKQALSLSPNVVVSCQSSLIDKWTWKILCRSENRGSYHADISIQAVKLSLLSDTKEKLYEPNSGYALEYPNGNEYRANPGSSGDIWLYLKFDKKIYQDGMNRSDVVVRAEHLYKTIKAAKGFVADQFPDLKPFIELVSTNGNTVHVGLPPALPE